MYFVYLDDFGHDGPYFSAAHAKHNTHPAFGFAGLILPESAIRNYSSFFIELKKNVLAADLKKTTKPAYKWEKKGNNLFTKKSISKYSSIKNIGNRLLNKLASSGGQPFYYGSEKVQGTTTNLNPVGLRTTVLSNAIRSLDNHFGNENFCLVMDEHSTRLKQLECAQKTMFGTQPARSLICPPFEVVSHLDQNMQAADWIACMVGRIFSFRCDPGGMHEYEAYETYYGGRIDRASIASDFKYR